MAEQHAKSPVTVQEFLDVGQERLQVEVVAGKDSVGNIIREGSLNRPGLALAGFFQYFAHRRIQVIGLAELSYLKSLSEANRNARVRRLFESQIPCVVVTRNRHAPSGMAELSESFGVPLLRTSMITMNFINEGTIILESLMSPRVRTQGTMVDIQGIGVLIEGEPGIGKSETALALIERSHSLVSDDVTILRKSSAGTVVGEAVAVTRYHMEIRGMGIIHVPSLFGVASMRDSKRLDVIIRLVPADPGTELDRTGLMPRMRNVLGTSIPCLTLPVGPGRDIAHLIEVAALNHKLKQLGHDAAKELDEKLVQILSRKGHE